ncbi:hypothetical protein [Sphingorhabdus sp.]|jgi:hypothetical protein|uniref:AtuA-related protein n=1 Tax=Sphingorhabdus sp. TaxID=1902408 RepID=UPI0033414AC5
MTLKPEKTVLLHTLAHARSGDKGNHSNIAVFAYRPELYPLLIAQVTPERVGELFASRRPTSVQRYLLPKLNGFNFVIDNVLDGGVNESLNLDMHGKSLSFLLLSMEVSVPQSLQSDRTD